MKLYVGFSTSQSFISRAICFITRAKESHAYLRFALTSESDLYYEAAWDGFRCRPISQGVIVEEYFITYGASASLAHRVCNDWWSTPYDYTGIIGELFVRIGRLFGKRWPNLFANPHSMFCSEAAALILKHIGHPLFSDMPDSVIRTVDPGMLAGMLKEYNDNAPSPV